MSAEEIDRVSGQRTTGHEWNGITELDTPVPRGILIFIVVTHAFALLWWILMPTWPLGSTYTKGILGYDLHQSADQAVLNNAAQRASWTTQIDALSYDEIQANQPLMTIVKQTGRRLFGDNCAACHGIRGKGNANFPNLTDGDWLWGDGSAATIAETMRVGINSAHEETRFAQMPAFGRDQMLSSTEIRAVADFVYSLSHPANSTPASTQQIAAGRDLFAANCAGCHGENATGNREVGAPNLTDNVWLYGGDLQTIITTINGGRQGHMPTWSGRLTPTNIKILALYVHSLNVSP
ncbi:MAG: cytochrome-c oxidase, cbb3-type subunit III [Devosia sp.]